MVLFIPAYCHTFLLMINVPTIFGITELSSIFTIPMIQIMTCYDMPGCPIPFSFCHIFIIFRWLISDGNLPT